MNPYFGAAGVVTKWPKFGKIEDCLDYCAERAQVVNTVDVFDGLSTERLIYFSQRCTAARVLFCCSFVFAGAMTLMEDAGPCEPRTPDCRSVRVDVRCTECQVEARLCLRPSNNQGRGKVQTLPTLYQTNTNNADTPFAAYVLGGSTVRQQ